MTSFSQPTQLTTCREFKIGNVAVGGASPLVLIAGPCVIESRDHAMMMAAEVAKITTKLGVPFVFKASYDKANRSSVESYRGPGLEDGLEILDEIKQATGLPVLTDVHKEEEAQPAGEVCDCLQVPAFLCRQTDFVQAVGRAGKPVAVKKGQFLAPEDIVNVVQKLQRIGCEDILITERGASFGYHNLVSDFRALATMQHLTRLPVCFDATHSVQQPGGLGNATGGKREFVPLLARAACATGINALFVEVHDNPEKALSDGPNMLPLSELETMLRGCLAIDHALRDWMNAQ
ncbi:3-deoxy-8-phosphooctulonate synthase [bacterium]|nr:3-deoxy-8-phosphooctulonate synthase [bacterium]